MRLLLLGLVVFVAIGCTERPGVDRPDAERPDVDRPGADPSGVGHLGTAAESNWMPGSSPEGAFAVVLGVAQDGGVPQTGDYDHPGWTDASQRRLVSSIGLIDPESETTLLFDATPDLPDQLTRLASVGASWPPSIFLTHAHIGHYTGLMYLGHESLGASGVPVFAMPRMRALLESGGPWSQLVRYGNIEITEMLEQTPVTVGPFRVTPLPVPHRQEYSETVGFRVEGPERSVLFLPDIDSWTAWDAMGIRLEDELSRVDAAFLDATFYANGEIPGRDMSGFPHPFISHTMERLADLPDSERGKVHFIHLNHTNPALWTGPVADSIRAAGFHVAFEGQFLGM